MKQVGLNVASDPLLSAAYTGVAGGLVVVVADDPGPHSSQTEQDTRLFALMAKVPVLDPSTPREAKRMAEEAFRLSEAHRLPVIVRLTTRVCHASQSIPLGEIPAFDRQVGFQKDPRRWAATPRFRYVLHQELNEKLTAARESFEGSPLNSVAGREGDGVLGLISSGVCYSAVHELLAEMGLDMSQYPTDKHLASWAGLSPGNRQSGGKRYSGRTRKGNRSLSSVMVQAAWSATRVKDSFLKSKYHRLAARRGKKRAIVAIAHSMLISAWHMLTYRQPYQELGGDYFHQRRKEAKVGYLTRQLEKLTGGAVRIELQVAAA